ncbi:C-C motif chemokine 8-like isoform X1 [Labeo rohita]|uniref:C-C motif chemokine 8-like isoform X1 n=1 Tax=Labeo rohita TaxID=84645 RepID=A0A498NNL5_LABRO|nr:C-C motif chemokine 8-like isoform X1 [Labeo rohita]
MAWTSRLITIAVLIALMGCFIGAQGNYRRPTRVGVSCCKKVSKGRIPATTKLIGYESMCECNNRRIRSALIQMRAGFKGI